MLDMLVKNAIVVTVDAKKQILWNGAIGVKDGRIIEIGITDELCAKFKDIRGVIDASGKIVFPGFINTHTHLFQSLLKGLGDDMVLSEWLQTMTLPAASHLTEEDCYISAMLGGMEGLHSGITTTLDYMYPHNRSGLSDGIIRAFKELKIRGVFARGFIDHGLEFGVPDAIIQEHDVVEADCRRLFNTYHNSENGRIKIWVAPAVPWLCTKRLMKTLWNMVNEYDSGFTVHISETPFDRDATKQMYGLVDVELLQELGVTGPNVLMVHCVYLTERDIRMCKYYDMKVSHNAVSNMYLSSGVAPISRMIGEGIAVGLGVDGGASNNSQDMLELMKSTALLHKVSTKDPTVITAEKVLEMATIDGARAIGLENDIGSLEVGKKADFIIFNPLLSPKSIPMHNPISTLVYSSSIENIETVVVDGNIVMKNGNIVGIKDEKALLIQGQDCAEKLAKKAGIINRRDGHSWRSLAF